MRERVILFALIVLLSIWAYTARAQSTEVSVIKGYAPHTACPTSIAAEGVLCVASDGIYISVNGGALAQISTGAVAGVTSWNGLTGAVVYAPPVSSVNGKTGTVVLTASAPLIQ